MKFIYRAWHTYAVAAPPASPCNVCGGQGVVLGSGMGVGWEMDRERAIVLLISVLRLWLPGSRRSPPCPIWVTLRVLLNLSVPLQREANNNSTCLKGLCGRLNK